MAMAIAAFLLTIAVAQDCSATKLCATGCCSQYGFCGTDDAACGAGCQSTCDYKEQVECDANTPCADGTCCSKYGHCGFGPDYCAPDVCVNTCDAKSECDPGYGADGYATFAKCPLNVCCSKFGFCGIDQAHCGDTKVARPSCAASGQTITRVVGYYEGWAARRSCDAYTPENIPPGVYSHLNFAFAGIDPATFRVVPADPGDVALYSRLTKLKKFDPDLKVSIAIGGWAFNDPGATASVFTNLVASEANQRTFFASLISFMDTYGFDGVDIDWEYPVAEERAGREQDFGNYPMFIANLRSALDGAGGRGLTITLPVAYWYLRHFDIIKMEPHVDWFNMMSYDLHGAWDAGNKWLGNYLLSHTNLTEITDYFDLMWRNNIKPEKVVMGLAFYSRTFRATSGSCMDPGCTFSSVAAAGPCTGAPGVLSNAEVDERIASTGAEAQLDKDAAVKILKIGTDWITYDDVDTWKLKADFVRRECLGGVMVWAVSLDKSDGTYSKQLQVATGFQSKGVTNTTDGDGRVVIGTDERIQRDQCRWTDCGAPCPANFVAVRRSDDDGHGETMVDSTSCRNNGGVRTLCCPGAARMPICGWFDFNNGKCGYYHGSQCPDSSSDISKKLGVTNFAEVGSYSGACSQTAGFQVACCSYGEPDAYSANLYGLCQWRGKSQYGYEPTCGDGYDYQQCSGFDTKDFLQVDAWSGSGAANCYHLETGLYYYQSKVRKQRAYCCESPTDDKQWGDCHWAGVSIQDNGFCDSSCPTGEVRVAMDGGDKVAGCKSGAENYCCNPTYKVARSTQEEMNIFGVALQVVMDHQGQCLNEGPASKSKRASTTSASEVGLSVRVDPSISVFDACNEAVKGLQYFLNKGSTLEGSKLAGTWDAIVKPDYPLLSADSINARLTGIQYLESREADSMARNLVSNLQTFETYSEAEASEDESRCPYLWYIAFGYNTFGADEDDGGVDDGPGFSYEYGGGDGGTFDKKRSINDDMDLDGADGTGKASFPNPSRLELGLDSLSGQDAGEAVKGLGLPAMAKYGRDEIINRNFSRTLPASHLGSADEIDEVADELYRLLEDRADQKGNPRTFNSRKGTREAILMMKSSYYPNGDNGDQLIRENGDNTRYYTKLNHHTTGFACVPDDYELESNAIKAATKNHWVTEHILELQTIPRFIDWIADEAWPKVRGPPGMEAKSWSLPTLSGLPGVTSDSGDSVKMLDALRIYGRSEDWPSWANLGGDHLQYSPLNLMLNRLGSVDSLDVMVVCDSDLNAAKAELYRFNRVRGNDKWKACCSRTNAESGRMALSVLQTSLAVFDYYDERNVKTKHQRAYHKVKDILSEFQNAYSQEEGKHLPLDLTSLWRIYLVGHLERVVTWSKWWIDDRISGIIGPWESDCNTLLDDDDKEVACGVSGLLKQYSEFTVDDPHFDTTIFD